MKSARALKDQIRQKWIPMNEDSWGSLRRFMLFMMETEEGAEALIDALKECSMRDQTASLME